MAPRQQFLDWKSIAPPHFEPGNNVTEESYSSLNTMYDTDAVDACIRLLREKIIYITHKPPLADHIAWLCGQPQPVKAVETITGTEGEVSGFGQLTSRGG